MNLREFLGNPEWDKPFYKVLAHNDTGEARGNQAGMVIPKELREFLPSLDEAETSSDDPTTDRQLLVEMYLGTRLLTEGNVRYQLQTWGGTRNPESRITDGFQPLYNRAAEDDLLIFQRRNDALNRFRLILAKQGTTEYAEAAPWIQGRKRWGTLLLNETPVTQQQLSTAREEIIKISQKPFTPITAEIRRVETRQSRIARSLVFRAQVRAQYKFTCAVTGIVISTPTGINEVEAAHVIPLNVGGSDDVRNGLALTQSVHWAFDRGLLGIRPDRTVYVPRRVKQMPENSFLLHWDKRQITEAATENFRVHNAALEWHFNSLVKQWD